MRIDIFADIICPWCFIGKRRLDTALAQRPALKSDITWRPFQLNPDMPAEGIVPDIDFTTKFGSQARVKCINEAVVDAGKTIGITFAFDKIMRIPNTLAAHRLIHFVQRDRSAIELIDRLFTAYFVEGRNIGDHKTLAAIASESGLDADLAHDFLAGTSGCTEVLADDADARRLGINAVPCFVFAGQYAISGAQEPPFLIPVLDLVQNSARAAG